VLCTYLSEDAGSVERYGRTTALGTRLTGAAHPDILALSSVERMHDRSIIGALWMHDGIHSGMRYRYSEGGQVKDVFFVRNPGRRAPTLAQPVWARQTQHRQFMGNSPAVLG
jgi:hypothetical protein